MTFTSRLPPLSVTRMNLVVQAAGDEDRALVAEPHRARVGDAGCPDLDLEALRHNELVDGKLVGGRRNRRRRDRRELHGAFGIRAADQRRAGRQRLRMRRARWRPAPRRVPASAGQRPDRQRLRECRAYRQAAGLAGSRTGIPCESSLDAAALTPRCTHGLMPRQLRGRGGLSPVVREFPTFAGRAQSPKWPGVGPLALCCFVR